METLNEKDELDKAKASLEFLSTLIGEQQSKLEEINSKESNILSAPSFYENGEIDL